MNADLKRPNVERLLTVMRGGIPDRVPNYEILIDARNVKALLGKDVGTIVSSPGAATSSPPATASWTTSRRRTSARC